MMIKHHPITRTCCGSFTFQRYVSSGIKMSGSVIFKKPSNARVIYLESGQYLNYLDQSAFFQQQTFEVLAQEFRILKQDGSLLHVFEINEKDQYPLELKHTHQCGLDQYVFMMTLQSPDKFKVIYDVKGHNKAYQMKTTFLRKMYDDNGKS